jgi:hypothetical protein
MVKYHLTHKITNMLHNYTVSSDTSPAAYMSQPKMKNKNNKYA